MMLLVYFRFIEFLVLLLGDEGSIDIQFSPSLNSKMFRRGSVLMFLDVFLNIRNDLPPEPDLYLIVKSRAMCAIIERSAFCIWLR